MVNCNNEIKTIFPQYIKKEHVLIKMNEGLTKEEAIQLLEDEIIDLDFKLREDIWETQNNVKYGGI